MKQFKVTDIEWETDGRQVDAPRTAVVECEDEKDIADVLSDTYKWLVADYKIKSVRDI